MAAELVLHDSRLDADPFLLEIGLENAVHVLGEVDVNGVPDGLTGQAGRPAARQHRHLVPGAQLQQRPHVPVMPRNDRADRLDLPDGRVGGVQDPGIAVEADFALDLAADLAG